MRVDELKDKLRELIKVVREVSVYIPSASQGLHIEANIEPDDQRLVIAMLDPLIRGAFLEYPKGIVREIARHKLGTETEGEMWDCCILISANPWKGITKIKANSTREVATALCDAIIKCWSCESDRTNEGR